MAIHSLKALIRCSDLAASRSFYVDVLGLQVVEEWDDDDDQGLIVGFGAGGGFLELLAVDPNHSQHDSGYENPVVNDKVVLQIRVESVDDWAEQLRGVVATEGPVTRPWGNRYLYLRDPDSVSVGLFQKLRD